MRAALILSHGVSGKSYNAPRGSFQGALRRHRVQTGPHEVAMNRVPLPRRVQIINCLVEGSSIRSTERMTGTHRDTICRLLVDVGEGCAKLMNELMRELPCRRIEVDEI